MIRNLIKVLPLLGLVFTAVAAADARSNLAPIGGFNGLSFGQTPQEVDWLAAADWMPSGCPQERFYYLADVDRRNFLANVRLVWPGLLYRFLDNRLYAIQAEFPSGDGAFVRLRDHLTRKYGAPSMSESWQGAPPDTYVHQHRLSSVGWYGPDGARSIWLTNHDGGGAIIMIDNTIADWGIQRISERCSMVRTDIAAEAARSFTSSSAKE
jgi:hypothetical protein